MFLPIEVYSSFGTSLHGSFNCFNDNEPCLQTLSRRRTCGSGRSQKPLKGFVTPRFYLVRRLNIARVVVFDAFRSAGRSMWHLTTPVEVQAKGDRFLFTFSNERDLNRVKKGGPWGYQRVMILINDYDGFPNIMAVPLDFVWIWVEIEGLPIALTTEAMTKLVGETIGTVLQVDNPGLNRGVVRVHINLPLNNLVSLKGDLGFPLKMLYWSSTSKNDYLVDVVSV